MAEDVDIEASGLLDGLEGQARAERAELIEWLRGKGFTVEQIRAEVAPMLLPAGRIVGNDGVYVSARQICEETGIDLELLEAIQRAMGLPRADDPDAVVHLRADSQAAANARVFIDMGLSREQVITVSRVLGHGLAQTAEAMRQVVLEAVMQPGATELQLAQAYEGLVHHVSPLLGPLCDDVLRVQLRHTLETEAVSVAERAAGTVPGARNITVAFADLVGFTRLGEAVPPEELENLARRLSNLAHDVVAPPVRFIKTIGDAVMFVSTDPVALLRAALTLVTAAEKFDDFPQLRVGVASGLAVSRAGDWFGSPVNVASRVTGVARAGAVLVSESARDTIVSADGFEWSFAGARHLKGVKGEVKLFRARATGEESRQARNSVGAVAEIDFEALGLLDGLAGEARKERADLIAWLIDRGFKLEHIRASVAAPLMLPAYRVLGDDGERVSAREICESTGVELELLQRLQRAVGLPRIDDPDAAVLLRADGEAAARAKFFLALGLEPEDTVAVMRVLVESLSHAAAMMREAALKTLLRPGASEIELAQASEQLALRAAPMLGPLMEDLIRLELRHSFEMEAVNAAERAAGTLPGARPVTVAFADLAGFTRLGEALPAEELEHVASRLAELAHDVAELPVRFVKSIGDAVMFVSFDAVPLLAAVLDLADAAVTNDLPRLRTGVASGCAVTRAGDWYGSPVNLASRVTAAARPGTVLVAESARDAVGNAGGFEWSSGATRRLKGVSGEVKLFRVERSGLAENP